MSIVKLINKPAKIFVSELAKKNCRLRYGDDLAGLMLESVKNIEQTTTAPKPKTFFEKIMYKIRPEKELSIGVFSNKDGDFYLQSNMKIGSYNFPSDKHMFNFMDTIDSWKNFKKVVDETKEDILKQIATFNKNKRFFKL